jgi:hypothetical protein
VIQSELHIFLGFLLDSFAQYRLQTVRILRLLICKDNMHKAWQEGLRAYVSSESGFLRGLIGSKVSNNIAGPTPVRLSGGRLAPLRGRTGSANQPP